MHFSLAVSHMGRITTQQLRRVITRNGGLRHADYSTAVKAASAISKSELVMHVTITCVSERHDSIWRKGRKS